MPRRQTTHIEFKTSNISIPFRKYIDKIIKKYVPISSNTEHKKQIYYINYSKLADRAVNFFTLIVILSLLTF